MSNQSSFDFMQKLASTNFSKKSNKKNRKTKTNKKTFLHVLNEPNIFFVLT